MLSKNQGGGTLDLKKKTGGGTCIELRIYSCEDIICIKCSKNLGGGHFVQSSLVNNKNILFEV